MGDILYVLLFAAILGGWLLVEVRGARTARVGLGLVLVIIAFSVGLIAGRNAVGMQRSIDRSRQQNVLNEVDRRLAEDDIEGARKCIDIFSHHWDSKEALTEWETYLSDRKPLPKNKGAE